MMAETPRVVRLEPGQSSYPLGINGTGRAPILSAMGNLSLLEMPGLGFCGSRKASVKGITVAEDCAEQAVKAGFAVISGYAAGVDFAAHRAALASGGATVLVLAKGIERFSIRQELKPVWDWERALVISQFSPNATWKVWRAMQRNEVIIGLSCAMVVIEAGEKGGTIAAGLRTLELGKPLFVADYENIETVAPGNALLLAKGATRLRRSRETGRANITVLEKIRKTVAPVQPVLL